MPNILRADEIHKKKIKIINPEDAQIKVDDKENIVKDYLNVVLAVHFGLSPSSSSTELGKALSALKK